MKVYFWTYCIIILIFSSCKSDLHKKDVDKESENTKDSLIIENKIEEKTETKAITTSYNGSWFTIDYPSNFKANPVAPIENSGDTDYVEISEASFTSPNGEVEFFVYSPQWGGNPKTYLNAAKNEELISEKEEKSPDITFPDTDKITRWYTFKDVSGSYIRSAVSIKTESTHHVFGVKYKNVEIYEKYKNDYLKFKKSLIQYAD